MTPPSVSILIPVYNRQDYLPACIQSALDQTFADFEIVITDNASTDGTWNICEEFARRDSRVRIFRNEVNIGPVRNWLSCLAQARGKFIKILFSDDLMLPDFLAHTLPYLEDPDIAFVSTAAIIGESIETGHAEYALSKGAVTLSTSSYMIRLISGLAPYSPGAAIFRARDARENLLAEIPTRIHRDFALNGAGPDVLLYTLTSTKYPKVAMLPQADVFFRAHLRSITICNEDNDVFRGYHSALAWFFRNRTDRRFWTAYVARLWLSGMIRARRWISLKTHCLELEGDGSIAETFRVVWYSFRKSPKLLLQRFS